MVPIAFSFSSRRARMGMSLAALRSGGGLSSVSAAPVTTVVEGMDPSTDGIEHVQGNEFIVSCWAGAVYHVKGGENHQLLDTRTQKINSADIGYDPKGKVVYVPTFFVNTVAAYELK